jgi:hypothetical protein
MGGWENARRTCLAFRGFGIGKGIDGEVAIFEAPIEEHPPIPEMLSFGFIAPMGLRMDEPHDGILADRGEVCGRVELPQRLEAIERIAVNLGNVGVCLFSSLKRSMALETVMSPPEGYLAST